MPNTSAAKIVNTEELAKSSGDPASMLKAAVASAEGASKYAVPLDIDAAINAAIDSAASAGILATLPSVGEAFKSSEVDIVLQDEGNGALDVTGVDGFVGVDVRFTYASPTMHKLASLGLVGLVFSVDGVDSAPTPPVTFSEKSAQLASGRKCAKLVTVVPPPETAIVDRPFGWKAEMDLDFKYLTDNPYKPIYPEFKAVDANGDPIANLTVVAVSEENFQERAPEFYSTDLDYTFTDTDGLTKRKINSWYSAAEKLVRENVFKSDKNRDNLFVMWRGPRSDVIRNGPSGTMKMRYVAINTKKVDSDATSRGKIRTAYENEVSAMNTKFQQIADKTNSPGADALIFTAPYRFALKSQTPKERLCDNDNSVPGHKAVDDCAIECVSDVFEVKVENPVASITVAPVDESNPLEGAYMISPDRSIRLKSLVSYDPSVASCALKGGNSRRHARHLLEAGGVVDSFDAEVSAHYNYVKFTIKVKGIKSINVVSNHKSALKDTLAAHNLMIAQGIKSGNILLTSVADGNSTSSIFGITIYLPSDAYNYDGADALKNAVKTILADSTALNELRDKLKTVTSAIEAVTKDTSEQLVMASKYFVQGVDVSSDNAVVISAVQRCGAFLSILKLKVSAGDGSGVYGKLLDIDLRHFPPTLDFLLPKRKRICPSRQNPHCYFDLKAGKMHWKEAKMLDFSSPSPDILDGTSHQFTVFCHSDTDDCDPIIIFRQRIAGTKNTGLQEMQTMFMPGNAGEYTFIFGHGGIYSNPVTVVVESRLTGIEIVQEPTEAQLAARFGPGEEFPIPTVKVMGVEGTSTVANPKPIASYRVTARFIDDAGKEAPTVIDVGRENFDNILGTGQTTRSGADGRVAWGRPMVIDAVDGCYRMQFMYAPCGGGSTGRPYLSACPTVKDLQPKGYFGGPEANPNILEPVISPPTTRKWCFSSKGMQFSINTDVSVTTAPGVNLPKPPVMRLTMPYKNKHIFEEGIFIGFLMPYSIKRSSALALSTNITAVSNDLVTNAIAGAGFSADSSANDVIAPSNRYSYAMNTLTGNMCVWTEKKLVYGRCKQPLVTSELSPVTSQTDATGAVIKEYVVESTFDGFQWNRGVNGELMQLLPAMPVHFYFPKNAAVSNKTTDDLEPSSKIQLRLEASTIAITLQPREVVEVGRLFEVRVKVTIASGAPLPFVNVIASIAPGAGSLTETSADYLNRIFGAQTSSTFSYGLKPELDAARLLARTNHEGVARFKLKVNLGKPGLYALFFSLGEKRSAKSASFRLVNRVTKVAVTSYAPTTVRVDREKGFPAVLSPGSKVSIKVMDSNGTGIAPTEESMIFRTQVVEVYPGFEDRNQSENINELMNGKGESGVKELQAVYSVVVEGAKRLKPRNVASNKATFYYDGEPVHVGDGVYEFKNPRLVANAVGVFRVQFIVQGIAASVTTADAVGHDQEVKTISEEAANTIKWLNTIAVFVLITLMFAGSFPHTRFPRLSLVSIMIFSTAGIAVVPVVSSTQHPTWWITLYASIASVIFLTLISLLCTLVNHPATHSFAQRREASMFAYTRLLFSNPASAQACSAPENDNIAYHLKASVKDMFGSALSGISKDAFFYPTRVVAAFFVANAVVVVLMLNFIAAAIGVSETTRELSRKTVNTIFTYTPQLEESFYALQFADLKTKDEEWAYTQARSAERIFNAFGDAYEISTKIGVSIGFLVFFFSWIVFIAHFRSTMLRMRRGIYEWKRDKIYIKKASEYTGVHVSTSLISFALFSALVTVVFLPLSSPLLLRVLWSFVVENWPLILAVLLPIVINVAIKILFLHTLIDKNHIKRRWAWALWEVWDLIAQLLAGVAKGIARWIMAIIVAMFAIARVDQDALPAWVVNVVGPMLDPVASRVRAMMQLTHMHNAPVFRVAAWIIQRGGEDFARRPNRANNETLNSETKTTDSSPEGFISVETSRVRNRFQVALLIHKNPKLAEFRGAALQAAREEAGSSFIDLAKERMFSMCMPKKKVASTNDEEIAEKTAPNAKAKVSSKEEDVDVEDVEEEDVEREGHNRELA